MFKKCPEKRPSVVYLAYRMDGRTQIRRYVRTAGWEKESVEVDFSLNTRKLSLPVLHFLCSCDRMSSHVCYHFRSRLYLLSATRRGAIIGAEDGRMGVLHVTTVSVASQQSLATQDTCSHQMLLRVRAIDNRTGDIIEVRLLGLFEGLGNGNQAFETFALIGMDKRDLAIPA